jgi:hypothetical protein
MAMNAVGIAEWRGSLWRYRRESGDSAEVQGLLSELAAINPEDPVLVSARTQGGN